MYNTVASLYFICPFFDDTLKYESDTTTYLQRSYVPLKRCTYDVNVENYIVEQTIKFEYENNENKDIEAIYTFPLHYDVCVYDFEAVIGSKVIKTKLVEKKEAKKKYKKAKEEGKKVVMMSKDNCDMFTCNIGNLSPEQTAIITIKSCYLLSEDSDYNNFRLTIPLSVTPRYTPKNQYADKTKTTLIMSQITSILDNSSTTSVPYEIQVRGTIKMSCSNITIKSISGNNPLLSNLQPNGCSFSFENIATGHDIVLGITRSSANSFLLSERNMDVLSDTLPFLNYVHLLNLVPTLETTPIVSSETTSYVILADNSGSMMYGHRLRQMKSALTILLEALPDNCGISMYYFNDEFEKFQHNDKILTSNYRKDAASWIKNISANGGTEFVPILQQAITDLTNDNLPNKNIFFLTDGDVDNRKQVLKVATLAKATGIRIFPLGIGNGCSKELLNEISEETGGISEFVQDTEDMMRKLASHIRKSRTVTNPVSLNIDTQGAFKIINENNLNCLYGDTNNVFKIISTKPIDKIVINNQEIISTPVNCGLVKIVGKHIISKSKNKKDIINTSLNTGVLCDHTNFIGVEEIECKKNNKLSSPKKKLVPLPNISNNYDYLEHTNYNEIQHYGSHNNFAAMCAIPKGSTNNHNNTSYKCSRTPIYVENLEETELEIIEGFGYTEALDCIEEPYSLTVPPSNTNTNVVPEKITAVPEPPIKLTLSDLPEFVIIDQYFVSKKEEFLAAYDIAVGDYIRVTSSTNNKNIDGIYEVICIGSKYEKWILRKV